MDNGKLVRNNDGTIRFLTPAEYFNDPTLGNPKHIRYVAGTFYKNNQKYSWQIQFTEECISDLAPQVLESLITREFEKAISSPSH
jgi:hypothetical protein